MENNFENWYCPLLKDHIEEGYCLDINYERLDIFHTGTLNDILKKLECSKEYINITCESCPNFPLSENNS